MDPEKNLEIFAEITPNPNTLKFNVNRPLLNSGTLNFPDHEKARGSALAEGLFEITNVIGVMVGRDFITVTKAPAANWQDMAGNVTNRIQELLNSGKTLLPQTEGQASPDASSEIAQKIMAILDSEIRPAVNMDGGDITFHGYENGIVTLHLQGSCSHCPSSIMTLKMGVENRLKSLIPEIREVVQI